MYRYISSAGNFAVGTGFNEIRLDRDLIIPDTFRNGKHLDESEALAYSAYSKANTELNKFDTGKDPENQHRVIFINYGRLQDYEELFRNSAEKITKQTLKTEKFVLIARYNETLVAYTVYTYY